MELMNPFGLALLGALGILVWWFRRRDRLNQTHLVSTRRWFTEIASNQKPQWQWQLWPILLSAMSLVLLFTWLWTQPNKTPVVNTTEVWDAGLNMPDKRREREVTSYAQLMRWLETHNDSVVLHTNLQVTGWDNVTLPSNVRVVQESLPKTVGVTNAGIVDGKVWVQLHNTTEKDWAGEIRLEGQDSSRQNIDVPKDGAFVLLNCEKTFTHGSVRITSTDAWLWDDSFFIGRKHNSSYVHIRSDNPFILAWSKLQEIGAEAEAKCVIMDWDTKEISRKLEKGMTVVTFCDENNVADLAQWVKVTSTAPQKSRGITPTWKDLGSLRIVRYTTVAETQGWDNVLWRAENERVIVGEKHIGPGLLRVVMGPLTLQDTELPSLPVFLPWMSQLTQIQKGDELPQHWRSSRKDVPHVTEAGTYNYDRAWIQPVAGTYDTKVSKNTVGVQSGWSYLLGAVLTYITLILIYQWRKLF